MSSAFVPGSQQRYLRACMVCSIVQTHAVSSLRSPSPPLVWNHALLLRSNRSYTEGLVFSASYVRVARTASLS